MNNKRRELIHEQIEQARGIERLRYRIQALLDNWCNLPSKDRELCNSLQRQEKRLIEEYKAMEQQINDLA